MAFTKRWTLPAFSSKVRTLMRIRCLGLLMLVGTAPAFAKPPRLTLFITVDALGSDLYWRMRPKFRFGLNQVAVQGAFFPNTRYDYVETHTAPGHTTLATGANPSRHGIVSNKLFNRQVNKLEPAFVDPGHPALEAPLEQSDVSPQNLLAETLSDRLKLSTYGRGKSVSISGKGRAAIAMAGRLGQAWWFNESIGRFVTGTYYLKEVPAWMKAFNDKKVADSFQNKEWALSAPAKEYLGTDDRPFESDVNGMGRTFPHPLNGGLSSAGPQSYAALATAPQMNDILVQAAKAAIDGEQLGKDDVPDFLAISFSSFDRIFHAYGPYSWEMQDAALRLDRTLGDLIALAERAAGGKPNLLVVLSSDHGGAAIPEEWATAGLNGVRVSPSSLKEGLNKELMDRFKSELVVSVEETSVYLDWKLMGERRLDAALVRRAAATWLAKHPSVAYAVSREDLERAPGSLGDGFRAGFHPDRSGDVFFTLKPFSVLEQEPGGTSHGTAYAYDNTVPTFFLGRGVKPGFNPAPIRAVDVASTTATLMEMGQPASCEGSAKAEAMTTAPR